MMASEWHRIQDERDAALAAAAEDLYDALKAFVEMSATDDVNAIIEQAKAALAKARGETA